MLGARQVKVLSYTLYADDTFIFYKGKFSNITTLNYVFSRDFATFGQIFSQSKSTIYYGSMSDARLDVFVARTRFSKGNFPINYLGVTIFKGRVKAHHLHPIANKILSKIYAWKCYLLSIANRGCLVKSVI